jgi:eukaryotic-like serine/threonine-protein kinase
VSSTPRTIDAGVRIGDIFVDKYRVDAFLGHGGMGVVAQCTHLALNERVAIKMLRRDVLDDADAVERFMREAQAASKLRSEHVARVTDVGRSNANVPYMVMEYLEGHDLDELLEDRGTISRAWAVELTVQACEALAEAHSLGIVHRDIKPSNLFVTWRPDGSALIKVLDFGISKALTGDAMRLTQTQSLLGTPAYMSPEQMRSARHVDARTDVWSLGTVLFEMLEGRRPFEAESFSEMCVKVAVDPPGAMPNTPPALQQVVLRCLAKPPEQRYASMAELGRDLVPFARNPHQAQLLAERMARTLRRSQVIDWEPALGAPGYPPPLPVLQSFAVPQIAAAVSPAAAAATAAAAPTAAAATAATAATDTALTEPAVAAPLPLAAAASLSTTYRIPGRRRWRAAVVFIAAVAGATTIGIVVSRGRGVSTQAAPVSRPAPPRPAAGPTPPPSPQAPATYELTVSSPSGSDSSAPPSDRAPAPDPRPELRDRRSPPDRPDRAATGRSRTVKPSNAGSPNAKPLPTQGTGSVKPDATCAFDNPHDGCTPAARGRASAGSGREN